MAQKPDVDAIFARAQQALKRRDVPAARKQYRLAARSQPKNSNVLRQAGYLAYLTGDLQVAIQYWRQAVAITPKNPLIFSQIGAAYRKLGDLSSAKTYHLKALTLDSQNPMVRNNLGNTLRDLGEGEAAGEHFEAAVRLAPDYAEAHANLGNVHRDNEDWPAAEACYRRAVELKPDYADAWCDLGNTLTDLERVDEAIDCFRQSIKVNPNFAPAYLNLSSSLQRKGRLDGTEDLLIKALQLDPNLPEAWSAVGSTLHQQGRDEEAVGHLRKALEMKPELTTPYLALAGIQSVGLRDDDITQLLRLLESGELPENKQSDAHFALARAYEARKDFDPAFEHVMVANRIDRKKINFSAEDNRRFIDRSIELFNRDFFNARTDFGVTSDRPILVLGLPRSGTTLVEQILASHPAVHGAGELIDFPDVMLGIPKLIDEQVPFPDNALKLDSAMSRTLGERYLELLDKRDSSHPRITDKLPFNFRQLGLFRLCLPNAKIIHCRRDPRDIAVSCFFIKFTKPISFAYDLDDFANYYRDYVRLMEHWHELFPETILDLKYEDLVSDQEAKSRQLIEFCGLLWDDNCLNFHENKREVKTASSWQVRQPVYKTSMERWRRYEKFLGPVLDLA